MSTETPQGVQEQTVLLYAPRKKLYPRDIKGIFNTWRWVLVWATQLLYYSLPWLNWDDRPAVLLNLVERKFYIFGLVLWPQDFIYLTALLVTSAFSLFLFTAVAGRLFCGYACPQTVYTEIFMKIEHWIEGDRAKRMRLDTKGPAGERMLRRGLKYLVWLLVALWTGFTFAGYFTPIRELGSLVLANDLGPWQAFWILFYSGFTILQAGFMREQVCKYMCPYARFQSVMFDRDTMIVTYDEGRGEPRGSRSKKIDHRAAGKGDCIDCGVCVEVCPTGIDIRMGLQYECIGCGLCVDGCNSIMDKMNYPRGLIRYSTQNAVAKHYTKQELRAHIFRPRVIIYGLILGFVMFVVVASLFLRTPLKVDIMRDRGALAREVDGVLIENTYQFQFINTDEKAHTYKVTASGLPGLTVASGEPFDVPGTSTRLFIVRMQSPIASLEKLDKGSHKIQIRIESLTSPDVGVDEKAAFFIPR
ncbi:MAG: cytochrome c oxidase accessory protein CcoG [Burkholderiaceae bacterium]|nr:cytochrome c oxidase accessory protein CcoG [Burkholderiaceae bacterium]